MKTQLILSRSVLTASALALASIAVPTARADVFGSGANTLTLEFVTIGNAGNADDAGAGGGSYSSPYGGVSYGYRMGTYEISQDAIEKATAGGLASDVMLGIYETRGGHRNEPVLGRGKLIGGPHARRRVPLFKAWG